MFFVLWIRFVQNSTYFMQGDCIKLSFLISLSLIESADLMWQHYFCKSNLFICGSDSSPCSASNLAQEISVCSLCCHANQFSRDRGDGIPPTDTCKHHTASHRATTAQL